jgi:general secretion pathway protein B
MSYILEALKKAEAERSAARLADIPMAPAFARIDAMDLGASRRPWLWVALPVTAISLAATAWFFTRDKLPVSAPAAAPVAIQAAKTEEPASLPQASAEPGPKPSAPASPAQTQTPRASAVAPQELPPVAKEEAPEKPTKPTEKRTKKVAEKKQELPQKVDKTPAPVVEPPIAALRELPEQIQREIPPFSINGYIYSGNKAHRSVLINKRLLKEGDEIAPGLLLEKMTPSGMVLNYKGYRYRSGY